MHEAGKMRARLHGGSVITDFPESISFILSYTIFCLISWKHADTDSYVDCYINDVTDLNGDGLMDNLMANDIVHSNGDGSSVVEHTI